MKNLRIAAIALALLLLGGVASAADFGGMRISLAEGDVQINTPETKDWGRAAPNTPLAEGDQLWVPAGGRAEVQLSAGTMVRLDQNSALQVLSLDKGGAQFYLERGNAYVYHEPSRSTLIQIDSPDASVRTSARSVFRLDISDHATDVGVYKGSVEAENRAGATRVNAGQTLSLGTDTPGNISAMGAPDAWERWNKQRNDRLFASAGANSRYLPSELRSYSSDFDGNGRWVEVPEYGYVWTPTAIVRETWVPYRYGR
ncbi:MAG TPA: FecR family protein, partial [Dissulfurispiraceae bacterium]|nr:FecR family protein [Dissulfurispiraceae bacterium]